MKQAHLWFACDKCDEESPPASTWRQARAYAMSGEWSLTNDNLIGDYCPDCTKLLSRPAESDDK